MKTETKEMKKFVEKIIEQKLTVQDFQDYMETNLPNVWKRLK